VSTVNVLTRKCLLDVGVNVLNGVVGHRRESDGLAVRVAHLHTTTQMQSELPLELVVVGMVVAADLPCPTCGR